MMSTAIRQRRSPLGLFPDKPAPRLYDRIIEVLRVRHYSRRTEEAYIAVFAVGLVGVLLNGRCLCASRPGRWLAAGHAANSRGPVAIATLAHGLRSYAWLPIRPVVPGAAPDSRRDSLDQVVSASRRMGCPGRTDG